jgi:hypothetical protein
MKATGFKGASNVTNYQVKKDGAPFNLVQAGITRIEFVQSGKVLSSNTDSINFYDSFINVKWGSFNLLSGNYRPVMYAYRDSDSGGEVMIDFSIDLKIIEDQRPS